MPIINTNINTNTNVVPLPILIAISMTMQITNIKLIKNSCLKSWRLAVACKCKFLLNSCYVWPFIESVWCNSDAKLPSQAAQSKRITISLQRRMFTTYCCDQICLGCNCFHDFWKGELFCQEMGETNAVFSLSLMLIFSI